MNISVLILTYNEECNIAECISSIPWKDDIHVLDSNSKDKTQQIAKKAGAIIHTRPFTNYAEQRNFGFSLPFLNEWILNLDADERMTPELASEIKDHISRASLEDSIYRVRRKDMFMGRWLKRASGYPTWFPRVFRKGRVLVEREINEEYTTDGSIRHLDGHILHYPFNKGVDWWFERHNRYSSMEAKVLIDEQDNRPIYLRHMIYGDAVKRRATLKQIAYRLPLRPHLIFIYLYFFRFGFLDGYPGFQYAKMRFTYENMINIKIAVLRYKHRKAHKY